MAIYFKTPDPQQLLKNFDARIAQTEPKGKIKTWEKSTDGKYYTHKAAEWNKLAWFKPKIENNQLTFNIIKPNDKNITPLVYAYYHGHLTETFLNHFDNLFTQATSSALGDENDVVNK